jgi:hypothetical protein
MTERDAEQGIIEYLRTSRPVDRAALELAAAECFFADLEPGMKAVSEALKDKENMIKFMTSRKTQMDNEFIALKGERYIASVAPYSESNTPEEIIQNVMPDGDDESLKFLRRWLFVRTVMFLFKCVITKGQRGNGLSSRTATTFAKRAVRAMILMELSVHSTVQERQVVLEAKQQYASRLLSFFDSTERGCDLEKFNQTSLRYYLLKVQDAIADFNTADVAGKEDIPINEVLVDLLATRTGLDILRRFAREQEQKKLQDDPERLKHVQEATNRFKGGIHKVLAVNKVKRFSIELQDIKQLSE